MDVVRRRDPADTARLADSANNRLLYRHAADAATDWPPCGWPTYSRSAATWTGYAPGPTSATRLPDVFAALAEFIPELIIEDTREGLRRRTSPLSR